MIGGYFVSFGVYNFLVRKWDCWDCWDFIIVHLAILSKSLVRYFYVRLVMSCGIELLLGCDTDGFAGWLRCEGLFGVLSLSLLIDGICLVCGIVLGSVIVHLAIFSESLVRRLVVSYGIELVLGCDTR